MSLRWVATISESRSVTSGSLAAATAMSDGMAVNMIGCLSFVRLGRLKKSVPISSGMPVTASSGIARSLVMYSAAVTGFNAEEMTTPPGM